MEGQVYASNLPEIKSPLPAVVEAAVRTSAPAHRQRRDAPTDGNIKSRVKEWLDDEAAARDKYGEIGDWDVSRVTNMWRLFYWATNFNSDISGWNVSRVTSMGSLFYKASNFNSDISGWNVSSVIDMYGLFYGASNFNSDLSEWNVGRVNHMGTLFYGASNFNQDLGTWHLAQNPTTAYIFQNNPIMADRCEYTQPGLYPDEDNRFPRAGRFYCKPNVLKDGQICDPTATPSSSSPAADICDTDQCVGNRCCNYQADATSASCTACTVSGDCFTDQITAASGWTDSVLTSPDFQDKFPSTLVGNGSSFETIKWNQIFTDGSAFEPADILARANLQAPDRNTDAPEFANKLTFELKWLAANVPEETKAALQVGQNLPLSPSPSLSTPAIYVEHSIDVSVSECNSQARRLNGIFTSLGVTADGKPYYKSKDSFTYLYYDKSCDGEEATPGRWIFGSKPSTSATSDLDADGRCDVMSQYGHIDSQASTPPHDTNVWRVFCDDASLKWTDVDVRILALESTTATTTTTTATTATRASVTTPWSSSSPLWDPDEGPGGIGIDSNSGTIFAAPENTGTYTAWLVAVDATGPAKAAGVPPELDQVLIKRWDLTVTEKTIFTVESFERLRKSHAVDLETTTKMDCAFNEECSIARVEEGSLAPTSSGKITYTVQVENDDENECDFALLINPDTGYMTGKYAAKITTRDQSTTCRATLSAVETKENLQSQTVQLETFEILFRPADTAVAANGPGGLLCANGGRVVDDTLYDKVFACDCSNSYFEGEACTERGPDGEACKHNSTVVDAIPFDDKFTCECTGIPNVYRTNNGQCKVVTVCGTGQEVLVAATATADTVCTAVVCQPNQALVSGACKTFALMTLQPSQNSLKPDGTPLFADPVAMQGSFYAVGKTYRFAPRTIVKASLGTTALNDAAENSSSLADIKFSLDGDPSEYNSTAFFAKSETGEFIATFSDNDAGKTYTFSLIATGEGGATVIVANYTTAIRFRDVDNPNLAGGNPTCSNGGVKVDETGSEFDGVYSCSCDGTGFAGDECTEKIQCTIDTSLQDGVCKPFVLAVDNATRDESSTSSNTTYTDPDSTPYFAVDQLYRIAPHHIINASTTYSLGSRNDVIFSMTGAPEGFFLNPTTGEMLGSFAAFPKENETLTKTVVIKLKATDQGGAVQTVERMKLHVRHLDVTVPAYGPGNQGCANGGIAVDDTNVFDSKFGCDCSNSAFEGAACTERGPDGEACKHNSTVVDAIPFDGRFTCDCSGITDVYRTNNGQCETVTVCGDGQVESVAATATTDTVCTAAAATDGAKNSSGVGIAFGVILTLMLIIGIGYKRRQHEIKMQPVDFMTLFNEMVASGDIETAEAAELRKHTPREIKRSFLTLIETIGAGQFGQVWKGLLDESPTGGAPGYLVAAKTVIASEASQEATRELQSEALVMAQVGSHTNLVSLVGVVTRGDPLVVIISYCEHGSLLSLLRKRAKERSPLGIEAKLKIGLETARGMQHLAANHFIHRDLAARNVLIATGMVAKVADFGLSRGMRRNVSSDNDGDDDGDANADPDAPEYYRSQNGIFPVRWTAPEAMESLKFSTASDVWSFGIVMVEMYQNGVEPYNGMSLSEVTLYVMSGKQHDQPPGCVTAMYELLCDCWSTAPSERPTFDRVIQVLKFNLERVAGSAGVESGTLNTASAAGYGKGTLGAASMPSEYEYSGTSLANAQLRAAVPQQQEPGRVVEETNLDDAAAAMSAKANGYGGLQLGSPNSNTTAALAGYGKHAVAQSHAAQGGYGNAVPWQEVVANSRLVSHATSFDPLFSVLLQRPLDKEDAALQRAERIFQMSYAPDAKTLYRKTPAEAAAAQAEIDAAAAAVAEKNRIAGLASELFQSGNPTNNMLPRSDVEALVNQIPRPDSWSDAYLVRYVKQAWARAKEGMLWLQIERGMMHEAEFQRLYMYLTEYIHNAQVRAAATALAITAITGGGSSSSSSSSGGGSDAPLAVLPAPSIEPPPGKKSAWRPGGGKSKKALFSKAKGNQKKPRRESQTVLMDGATLGEFEI